MDTGAIKHVDIVITQCSKISGTRLTECTVGYQPINQVYLCKTGEFVYQGILFNIY